MSGINSLSIPRGGGAHFCEVCRRPGALRCPKCKVTYYCGDSHRSLDANSFHPTVCADIAFLRGEHFFPIGEDERKVINDEIRKRETQVKEKAQNAARHMLLSQNPQHAYAAAMQAFHIAKEQSGDDDLGIVRPYTLLSETFLGLGNMHLAQELMIQAAWTVEKNPVAPVDVMLQVHRIRAKVHMAKKEWKRANECFAEYVYTLAERYGTEHISVACGYGYLGITIQYLGVNVVAAMEFYDKMAYMWLNKMVEYFAEKKLFIPTEKDLDDPVLRETEYQFLEAQLLFEVIDKLIQKWEDGEILDRFLFKLYAIQVVICIRNNDETKRKSVERSALFMATRTRMDYVVRDDLRQHLNQLLGDDYLDRWNKKHNRMETVATKYLENVKYMTGMR